MDNTEIINKIKKYKSLLKNNFEIEDVYLYGSYANGNPTVDSDIDVAIIVKQITGNYFTYTPLLWKLRRSIDYRIEPLLFIKNNDRSGMLSEIMKNGIKIPD